MHDDPVSYPSGHAAGLTSSSVFGRVDEKESGVTDEGELNSLSSLEKKKKS